jgi:hypothetical protein
VLGGGRQGHHWWLRLRGGVRAGAEAAQEHPGAPCGSTLRGPTTPPCGGWRW